MVDINYSLISTSMSFSQDLSMAVIGSKLPSPSYLYRIAYESSRGQGLDMYSVCMIQAKMHIMYHTCNLLLSHKT